jgi:hypothetical protein
MAEWLVAGRPVLVSNRGGLGEVAGIYPGSIPIDPTVGSIVSSISSLADASRWADLVAEVEPIEGQGVEEWAEGYLALYRSVTA